MKDTLLKQTKALPASDGTVVTTAIDLMNGTNGDFLGDVDCIATAPVLTTTELPDDDTATYKLEDSADNSTFADLQTGVITQTGADSSGAAAATATVRLPKDVSRYVRLSVTTAGTSGDCSGKSMTLELAV